MKKFLKKFINLKGNKIEKYLSIFASNISIQSLNNQNPLIIANFPQLYINISNNLVKKLAQNMKQTSLLESFLKRQGGSKKQDIKSESKPKAQIATAMRESIKNNNKMVLDSDEEPEQRSPTPVQQQMSSMKITSQFNDSEKVRKTQISKKQTKVRKQGQSLLVQKTNQKRITIDQDQEDEFAKFTDATPIWARKGNCLDAQKRPQTDPNYDPTTLYVPTEAWGKLTHVMKQFWKFKSENFDKIILFKLGKFYELFYDDAAIGNKYLDLKFMGTKMHSGFPQKSLEKYTNELVSLGFKTVVVQQMQTPAQMAQRVQREKKQGRKSEKGVNREITQILTRGTTVKQDKQSEEVYLPNYLISIRVYGQMFAFSLLEMGTNQIMMGISNNIDDFKTVLYQTRPVEVAYDPDNIPNDVLQIMSKSFLQMQMSKVINKNNLWHPLTAVCQLQRLQKQGILKRPKILNVIDTYDEKNKNLLYSTLSGMFQYLKNVLKFQYVMGTIRLNFYEKDRHVKNMILDSQAIQHLQLFQTSLGTTGSLFSVIDRTKTKFGRRLLRRWMMSPLMNTYHIEQRFNAVQDLQNCESVINDLAKTLKKLPDLQKKVNKLYHYAVKTTTASKAVYFQDINTTRLKQFQQVMKNMEQIFLNLSQLSKNVRNFRSSRLKQLLTITNSSHLNNEQQPYHEDQDDQSVFQGLLPDVIAHLNEFKSYIKWENNIPIPQKGLVQYYDDLQTQVERIKEQLEKYLQSVRFAMKVPNLTYVHIKERYQIQIPEKNQKNRPKDFQFSSKRNNFSRYITPTTKKLVKDLEKAEENLKEQMGLFIGFFFEEFKKKQKIWQRFIQIVAEIDCLMSLSQYSRFGNKVRPIFEESGFEILEAKHPCLLNIDFIPNDISLQKKTMLLTGPNMGGKSTLLRTACDLAILAQMGCFVPASSYRCETIDRIFTRIGASDKLQQGKSTFFIQMQQTKSVVNYGTKKSLAIIDQLGRGTSTFDGLAIAHSVLQYLVQKTKCYCLFATHYHILVDQFRNNRQVSLNMMDSLVKDDKIIFLYKLVEGNVSKSFGLNVARKVGIQEQIIKIAEEQADKMNKQIQMKRAKAYQEVIAFLQQ